MANKKKLTAKGRRRQPTELPELRKISKATARNPGAPTRNFSDEAIKAAAKFRGLKTAQLGKHVNEGRAVAIKRAVDAFYGLK